MITIKMTWANKNQQIFCDSLFMNESEIESEDELFNGFEDVSQYFIVDPFVNEGFH